MDAFTRTFVLINMKGGGGCYVITGKFKYDLISSFSAFWVMSLKPSIVKTIMVPRQVSNSMSIESMISIKISDRFQNTFRIFTESIRLLESILQFQHYQTWICILPIHNAYFSKTRISHAPVTATRLSEAHSAIYFKVRWVLWSGSLLSCCR